MPQTYEDGISSYKKANVAKVMNDREGERKALEKAYQIFKDLAAVKDEKSIVMYYLMSLKLRREFTARDLLIQYVKKEHPDYPTIEKLEFYGEDKKLTRDNIKKIARQNEEEANMLMEKAENQAGNGQYQNALDRLSEAEKTWEADEISVLKRNIRKMWSKKVLKEAEIDYKNENYNQALIKCDQAYDILPGDKPLKLKRKIKNKMEGKSFSRGSFALFIDGGIGENFKIDPFDYGWNWDTVNVSVDEGGKVKVDPESGTSIGYSFGMMKLFSPSWGVSASVSSFSQKINSESDYQFSWLWYTNRGDTIDENFTDSGKITVMPINLNLIAVLRLGKSAGINLYAGPTLYLTKIDLKTRLGYSISATKSDGYVYMDWFPYEFQVSESASIFGANVGLDFEYILGNNIGVYVGIQYFYVPKKEYNWQLIVKRYDGEFGNFYISDPSGNDLLEKFNSEVNLSTYKAHLGFKIYL
jgi:tetratricopeptide (TPR) repeat protein